MEPKQPPRPPTYLAVLRDLPWPHAAQVRDLAVMAGVR